MQLLLSILHPSLNPNYPWILISFLTRSRLTLFKFEQHNQIPSSTNSRFLQPIFVSLRNPIDFLNCLVFIDYMACPHLDRIVSPTNFDSPYFRSASLPSSPWFTYDVSNFSSMRFNPRVIRYVFSFLNGKLLLSILVSILANYWICCYYWVDYVPEYIIHEISEKFLHIKIYFDLIMFTICEDMQLVSALTMIDLFTDCIICKEFIVCNGCDYYSHQISTLFSCLLHILIKEWIMHINYVRYYKKYVAMLTGVPDQGSLPHIGFDIPNDLCWMLIVVYAWKRRVFLHSYLTYVGQNSNIMMANFKCICNCGHVGFILFVHGLFASFFLANCQYSKDCLVIITPKYDEDFNPSQGVPCNLLYIISLHSSLISIFKTTTCNLYAHVTGVMLIFIYVKCKKNPMTMDVPVSVSPYRSPDEVMDEATASFPLKDIS